MTMTGQTGSEESLKSRRGGTVVYIPQIRTCTTWWSTLLLIRRGHRVGVAFSEGPKLLPFYENLAKWQLLPLYAHILSVTFTVLPQTHNFVIARASQV